MRRPAVLVGDQVRVGHRLAQLLQPLDDDKVATESDRSHGMVRTEAVCANCGAHLGHVFPDGPRPTGERYCMNSASLRLDRDADPDEVTRPTES